MTKPNKDGWIRHRGGKCPVGDNEFVEVRCRAKITLDAVDSSWRWRHIGGPYDIMAFRLHQPETKEPTKMTAEQIRTKYTENLAAIAALHKEQASLVQQLRELGFAFVDLVSEPEEDMSDPKNWRVGDLVEYVDATCCGFTNGELYVLRVKSDGNSVLVEADDDGEENGWNASYFKFHSRPTKK